MRESRTRTRTTSPEPPQPGTGGRREALRDVVLTVAYDKTSRLNVPVFGDDHHRRLLYREQVAPIAARLAGSLGQVAEAISRVMSASARFEPVNESIVHRSYPSPRALFPVEVDLRMAGDGGTTRFRYEPDQRALHHATADGALRAGEPVRLTLELTAALSRIAPLYGELAPTLCALEAGHLACELASELSASGFAVRIWVAGTPSPGQRPSQAADVRLVLAEIDVEAGLFAYPGPARPGEAAWLVGVHLDARDEQLVEVAVRSLECEPADRRPLRQLAACATGARQGRRDVRSSGLFPNGYGGVFPPPGEADRLARTLAARVARLDLLSPELRPDVTVLRTQADGSVVAARAGEIGEGERFPDGARPLSEAFGTAFNIDLQTVPIVLAFSAPFGRLLAEQPAWAYLQMLVAAGILAQEACCSAAQAGYFARPFRGMVEQKMESAFRLEGQVFYTALIGKGGAANPHLSLGAPKLASAPAREPELAGQGL